MLSCLAVAWLALRAEHRPRVAQLLFLVVAAFVLTNKVYSPQYVLWLVFLFPLARPRWRDYLVWLLFEVVYFVAVWWHLQGLTHPELELPSWPHSLATALHVAATLGICALVVRDVLRPEHDPVREIDPDTRRPARGRPWRRRPRWRSRRVLGPPSERGSCVPVRTVGSYPVAGADVSICSLP